MACGEPTALCRPESFQAPADTPISISTCAGTSSSPAYIEYDNTASALIGDQELGESLMFRSLKPARLSLCG
jgi:hypothetical protein